MEARTKPYAIKTLVDLREANESDIAAISKICHLNQATREYWRYILYSYLQNSFNPHHALPDRIIYVATIEKSAVGFIAGHLTSRNNYPGQIQWIAVMRDFQRLGIGSELLWMVARWFIEKDTWCVRAEVERWQADLVNFYTDQKAERINSRGLCWSDIRTIMRN